MTLVTKLILLRQWRLLFRFRWPLAVFGMSALVVGPVRAQVLDQLSELLQAQSSPAAAIDELPAPQRSIPPVPRPLQAAGSQAAASQAEFSADPATETDSSQRIYLGLEAEELPNVRGLRVATVTRESPAWKAGFQENDRIIGINGFSITQMQDMIQQLETTTPGQSINFLINRAERTFELTAVLISQAMAQQIFSQPVESRGDAAWIGLTVHDLSAAFREQFGIPAYRGAAVTQVVPGSPGHRSGIRAGDAITEVDARPIESAQEFVRWLETVRPGDQVAMVVYRGITRIPTQVVLATEPRPQPSRPTFVPIPPRPRGNLGAASPGGIVNPLPRAPEPQISNESPETEAVIQPVTSREQELQREVERLTRELAEAQSKLIETRQQLNSILKALRE